MPNTVQNSPHIFFYLCAKLSKIKVVAKLTISPKKLAFL